MCLCVCMCVYLCAYAEPCACMKYRGWWDLALLNDRLSDIFIRINKQPRKCNFSRNYESSHGKQERGPNRKKDSMGGMKGNGQEEWHEKTEICLQALVWLWGSVQSLKGHIPEKQSLFIMCMSSQILTNIINSPAWTHLFWELRDVLHDENSDWSIKAFCSQLFQL